MICALLLLTAPADAARAFETPEVREARAERVLIAEVSGLESRWAPGEDGAIETLVELMPLAGADPADPLGATGPIEVVIPGGAVDGQWMGVSGAPRFAWGGVYRVSLGRDFEGRWRVLGGEAGAEQLSGPAPAPYALTGYSWNYEQDPIEQPFVLNAAEFSSAFGGEAAVEETILTIMDVWNTEAEAGFMIRYGGTTSRDSTTSDGSFTIHYDSTYYYDTGTLAISTYWGSGSRTTECDIVFYGSNLSGTINWDNDPDGASNSAQDFQYVATHEMGHCVGLSHSGSRDAIMYPSAPSGAGPVERRLDSDDIDAVQYLYGRVAPEVTVTSHTLIDPDGESEPGEALELALTLSNTGDGHAYDLEASLTGGGGDLSFGAHEPLEDIGPGRTETLVIPAEVGAGCQDEVVLSLDLTLGDLAGNTWSETLEVELICPASSTGGDGGGSGNGGQGSGGGISNPQRPVEVGLESGSCGPPMAPAGLPGLLLALGAVLRRRL